MRVCGVFGYTLCVALFVAGCTGDRKEEKTTQVSGTVDLDGRPLAAGDVTLVGDPGTVADVLPVKDGAFEGKAKLGKKKVEIRAYKSEKPPPSATGGVTESRVNYIPDRFNTNSALTAEVTDGGISPNKFVVLSK